MKTKIIVSSILIFFIAIIAILFGAVFRLRKQSVKVVGNEILSVSAEEIISKAELKNGTSIFFLDKDKAIDKIETSIPDIKVIQIKTTSVTEVEIVVRARIETYYTKIDNIYYVMDEELKVLKITSEPSETENLIRIYNSINAQADKPFLTIKEQTAVADFVGGEYKNAFYNLYTSIYKTATKLVEGEKQYLIRQEVIDLIESVTLGTANTLKEEYVRLIVKTSTGVVFDIAKPNEKLEEKVNMCISAYESGEYDTTKGVIKLFYNAEGKQDFDYFAQ